VSNLKLIPRSWVKNPIEDVLWCISKKNNLHVRFKTFGEVTWAYCDPGELDAFRRVARKFCLVCEPFAETDLT
jgi:hypothetical protein